MSNICKLLIPLWILVTALCFTPAFTTAADDDKKEAPPKVMPKEKEKEKEKKPKSTIEWLEIKTAKGVLKKPEYRKGYTQKPAELGKVEFSSESPTVRIKWTTKAPEGKRGGSLAMTLYKKKDSKGDKTTYQRLDRLGSARGDSEGTKTLSLGKGDFYIELDGDVLEYEIVIESAEKKEASE